LLIVHGHFSALSPSLWIIHLASMFSLPRVPLPDHGQCWSYDFLLRASSPSTCLIVLRSKQRHSRELLRVHAPVACVLRRAQDGVCWLRQKGRLTTSLCLPWSMLCIVYPTQSSTVNMQHEPTNQAKYLHTVQTNKQNNFYFLGRQWKHGQSRT
jgi:hypothetical protein